MDIRKQTEHVRKMYYSMNIHTRTVIYKGVFGTVCTEAYRRYYRYRTLR